MRNIKFKVWTGRTMMRPKPIIEIQEEQISGVTIGQMKQWKYLQYTGLKDKNGTEIYEGDRDAAGNVVEYLNGSFCLNGDRLINPSIFEVAGNIYQNPLAHAKEA